MSDAFRADTLERYGHECTLTGIQEDALLDLAHVLPRSQHPDLDIILSRPEEYESETIRE